MRGTKMSIEYPLTLTEYIKDLKMVCANSKHFLGETDEKELEYRYTLAAKRMISHRINSAKKKYPEFDPIDKEHQLELSKIFAKHARYIHEAIIEINDKRSEISEGL